MMEALVGAYKEIALDESKRESLLADATSLGGLVLLLSKDDLNISREILEIFSALTFCKNGSAKLSKLIGLKETLAILKSDENLDENLSTLASKLLDDISFKKPDFDKVQSARSKPRHQSHNVIVQLTGNLEMDDVKMIEDQLLTIKGLISITFQLNKLRVIVMALTTISKEMILDKVNTVCEKLASEKKQPDIGAHLLCRKNSTVSRHGRRRTNTFRSANASTTGTFQEGLEKQSEGGCDAKKPSHRPHPPTLKPYLSDEADVFEVDEKRGAPLPRDAALNEGGQRTGLVGWISDIFEKTLFW